MGKFLKLLICIIYCATTSINLSANHMIGGDFAYTCMGNNRFEITLTLWLDCLPGNELVNGSDDSSTYNIFEKETGERVIGGQFIYSLSSEVVPLSSSIDLSCINDIPSMCLLKKVFRFVVTLAPSVYGYDIAYQRYARTSTIVNLIEPGNTGATYVGEIPPFSDNECPNNSATFVAEPPQIICKGYNFIYDFSATDIDGDSLSYELCEAFKSPAGIGKPFYFDPPPFLIVDYLPPYTYAVPMHGTPAINIGATDGVISFTPEEVGRYVVKICVKEWRNGINISSVSRDMLFIVTPCSKDVSANMPYLDYEPGTYVISCDSKTVFFENNSIGGQSYLWDFGVDGATSTEFEPSFTYPDTGTYRIKLIVNPGSVCSDSLYRLVKIYPDFNTDFSYILPSCVGDTVYFMDQSTTTVYPLNYWAWNFGEGTNSAEQNPYHVYHGVAQVNVTLVSGNEIGCRDSIQAQINLPQQPTAGNDTIIVEGTPFQFHATEGFHYLWTPNTYLSNDTISNPVTNFPGTGLYTYVLQFSTDDGCVYTDTVHVKVIKEATVFIPTGFSPNGDGLNDVLKPTLMGYTRMNYMRIFNRWGNQVFYSTSVHDGWDGTHNLQPCTVGVYYWVISVIDLNGNEVQEQGDVTLLR